MNGVLKHPLRVTARLLWFGSELILLGFNFFRTVAFGQDRWTLEARARWLQYGCRRVLRILNVESQSVGPIPTAGLMVCNHLSYLDVLVLGALTPSAFVAKREVKYWPVFGWFAQLAGTRFVDRTKRMPVGPLTKDLDAILSKRILLILFPEGTSSDGQTVLPFKSSLLEPAARQVHCLSVGLLRYQIEDGNAGEEVCYWKDMTFIPHLLNLLSKRIVRASIDFSSYQGKSNNRKELARQLHAEVLRLKELDSLGSAILTALHQ